MTSYYYLQLINGDTGIVCTMLSRFIPFLCYFFQRVSQIVFANGERMSYANKLRIYTGAVMSFRPENLTASCLLLFLEFTKPIYESYCSTPYVKTK